MEDADKKSNQQDEEITEQIVDQVKRKHNQTNVPDANVYEIALNLDEADDDDLLV